MEEIRCSLTIVRDRYIRSAIDWSLLPHLKPLVSFDGHCAQHLQYLAQARRDRSSKLFHPSQHARSHLFFGHAGNCGPTENYRESSFHSTGHREPTAINIINSQAA